MEKKAKDALKYLKKIRELVAKRPSPFTGMSKDEVIEELRKTREQLWEQRLGNRDLDNRVDVRYGANRSRFMSTTHRQTESPAQLRRKARESLARLRTLISSRPSPFEGLSEEEAIKRIRAVREDLWHQKLAVRP
ncbi:hypothetical protein HYZ80_03460 [Candidatus Parcubacteria bacterium]|nr:hypothetical protein [Candidatus Parcubacteria bacterium]